MLTRDYKPLMFYARLTSRFQPLSYPDRNDCLHTALYSSNNGRRRNCQGRGKQLYWTAYKPWRASSSASPLASGEETVTQEFYDSCSGIKENEVTFLV